MLLRELGCAVGETLRRELVRSPVREVAGAVHRLRNRGGALGLPSQFLCAADEHEPLEGMVRLRLGLPATRVVGAEQEPVHDSTRLLGVGQRVVEEPGERPSDALGRFGNRGRGGADRVCVEFVRRPEAHKHDPPGGAFPSG